MKLHITKELEALIRERENVEFLVGNYGQFDNLAAFVIRELKRKHNNISLSLVIPYITREINENRHEYYKNYDSIIMADIPENTPKNLKIIKANQYMVNNSDFVICYINHAWGGAIKTIEYAKKKKLPICNLGSFSI